MSPCHSVSFEYTPTSGSAWPSGISISHLDSARLLSQGTHQVQIYQLCLQVTTAIRKQEGKKWKWACVEVSPGERPRLSKPLSNDR